MAAFFVGVERGDIVQGNLFAGQDVAQGIKLYVPVQDFHEAVWLAGMIDVVRAVAAPATVNAPVFVQSADAQDAAARGSAVGFSVRNSLTRVVRDFFTTRKQDGGKASLTVNT